MGADQIGFIVKIRKLDDTERRENLRTVISQRRAALFGYLRESNFDKFVDIAEWVDDLPRFDYDAVGISRFLDETEILDEFLKRSARELLDEYARIPWDARDALHRPDPDDPTQTLLFAGGMSWGESPDGFCYRYLKSTLQFDLWDALSIR